MAPRLGWKLRWRLSVLWILQWGITGTILTYLPVYLTDSGLSATQQGQLMAISAVGLWLAPFIVGQVTDRWMSSEKYLAISHFIGGVTLLALPVATKLFTASEASFEVLLTLFGIYAVCYFPTVPVATALSFRHLPDADAQFGKVRVWGTVGWMMAGFGFSLWLGGGQARTWITEHFPATTDPLDSVASLLAWLPEPSTSDCFRIAALLSFALSTFCIFLPATPPSREPRGTIAPLEILRMFRQPTFSLLIGISFLLALVVPLYTLQVPRMLVQMGIENQWIPAVMLIGQISEFPALLLLPLFLKRLGLKKTFAIGIGAWFVRYVVFALEGPMWLTLTALGLHGICHVFLIIVIQLYVDSQCRADLRATGQNLFMFITMGIGMPLGFLLGGILGESCFNAETSTTNYQVLFAIPAAFILLLLIAYQKWFRIEEAEDASIDEGHIEQPGIEPVTD